ncbi:MAG: hypothetical protein ABIJ56_05945 [Pseudomonadota bacterium]
MAGRRGDTKKKAKRIKFSIPYNGDLALTEEALGSGQVLEVYFAGPGKYNFSSPYVEWKGHSQEEIEELVRLCARCGVRTNFLVNKYTLFFEDLGRIEKYVRRLRKAAEISTITVSDPYIVPHLKKRFPRIRLQSSIFMGIDCVPKAVEALRSGIDDLCLDPSVNRSFTELSGIMRLKKSYPGMLVKLLGFHGCYASCFYAWRHAGLPVLHDVSSRVGPKSGARMFGRKLDHDGCLYRTQDISDEIKRPFIRPEDIVFYEKHGLADCIKLAYRDDPSELLREKFIACFERSYRGDLFHILGSNQHAGLACDNTKFPAGFIRKVMRCDKICDGCDYCDRLAGDCIE